jgi:alanine racemase
MRHSSFLEVNLGLLQENFHHIQRLSAANILPMVKADAYGNGLLPVSETLVEECGVKRLGCASLGEALEVYRQSPKLPVEMWVFSDSEIMNPELHHHYRNLPITPVLHHKDHVEMVLKSPVLKDLPLVLKINTGMNRLGISLEDLAVLAPRLKNRGVKHLMTHFACSYYPLKEGDKTHRQMEEFHRAKKILSDAGVACEETSVANSGAIEQAFGVGETYVRPGLMLYGPPSVEPQIWNGHQISKLVTTVISTFSVKKGTPVGYGINVAGEDGFIAIIPIGYADWSVTTVSGAQIIVNGMKARFFARVNMDMCFLMFEPSAVGKIKMGDRIEIWNHDNRVIADLATQMKTIPYHLMCGVTNRIPRIYKVK